MPASIALVVFAMYAWGQYQVNNQIYGNPGPSVRYGYGAGAQNYPTARLMPSENRNLVYRSGALPSDIRMGRAAVGPLPAQGFQAYVPTNPGYSRSSTPTAGNYVSPTVPNSSASTGVKPLGVSPTIAPRSTLSTPAMTGTIRYSDQPTATVKPVTGFTYGSAMPAGQPTMAQIMSTPSTGTIRYAVGN
jgi:hypothetical protein